MVAATNANAASTPQDDSFRYRHPWHPITRNELIRLLGTLVYKGRHKETNREYYWREDMHLKLSRDMSKIRWEQIHRFFKINDLDDGVRASEDIWFYELEPLMTTIRQNIQKAVEPASWLTVDELMVPFTGRSLHTIKIKNKPLSEGFKFWCIGSRTGYIFTWRCHSGPESGEGLVKRRRYQQGGDRGTVQLAPTHQVPMVLCQHVRDIFPEQQYLVFLDNLFLNVYVAHCLLEIGFFVMGTTRKNAKGVPKEILAIKNQGKTRKIDKDDECVDSEEAPASPWQHSCTTRLLLSLSVGALSSFGKITTLYSLLHLHTVYIEVTTTQSYGFDGDRKPHRLMRQCHGLCSKDSQQKSYASQKLLMTTTMV